MKVSGPQLITPVYLKTGEEFDWPENEPVFHLLTGEGLFLCRNHPFFRSSTPVPRGPSELAGHQPFMEIKYPAIPRHLFELVVGFFDRIGMSHGAEAAVLFAWNRKTEAVELVIPEQKSLVATGASGRPYPINVRYEIPPLPRELTIFGDAHSHVELSATASKTDIDDDAERPGLHIIVGRIDEDPPEISVHVTVDQSRFLIKHPRSVIEGYRERRTGEVPPEWIEKVTVIPLTWKREES